MIEAQTDKIHYRNDGELLLIEPWGPNALRVRSTRAAQLPSQDWALSERPAAPSAKASQDAESGTVTLTNGKIMATMTKRGKIIISNAAGKVLLEEYARNREDFFDPKCSSLLVDAREFMPIQGSNSYQVTARFESQDPNEKIFGMGQYQQENLDLKGTDLELAQRNSQASVPFAQSSRGYGFLWNNPAVGRAVFGKNIMTFEAKSSEVLDYWVVAGDSPAEIAHAYADVAGKVPMMPEYGLGFWQCKLRYQTQEELLTVARKHKSLGLPLDVIVCDFFHWPTQGEWKFDPTYWPDPKAMVDELKAMDVELMVSIWPTVDVRSENYQELKEKGYMVRTDRGCRMQMDYMGNCEWYDFSSKESREWIWNKVKQNYYDLGIKIFWLDEAEPEFLTYAFENYRLSTGPVLAVGNEYPRAYAQAFYEGQTQEGQQNVVNLLRCAWAGSQKYGALVWSGDIASSWPSLRCQLSAGLSMGLAGITWWTTDIGGFHGGAPADPAFRELLVRWFQWGTFCPVMRLHGYRDPVQPQLGTTGGAACCSGADNELWSYGDEVYEILKRFVLLREKLRDYTRSLMTEAHEKGSPVMRTTFYEFPEDPAAWDAVDTYMYGPKYLVAPVLHAGQTKRSVYLPKDATWVRVFEGNVDAQQGERYEGGQTIEVNAPLTEIPVFERQG